MAKQINVLQIGDNNNFVNLGYLPETLNWYYTEYTNVENFITTLKENQRFQLVIITTDKVDDTLLLMDTYCDPYCVLLTEEILSPTADLHYFLEKKCAFIEKITDTHHFMDTAVHRFFNGQYGARFHIKDMQISSDFNGEIMYQGYEYLQFNGDFGEEFSPIASWKYNLAFYKDNPIDFWPEYEKDNTVTIQYVFRFLHEGSTDNIYRELIMSEDDLKDQVTIHGENSYIAISIYAKGQGTLKVGPMHYRFSHLGSGEFLVGGKRITDSRRQEIIHYFYPGDLKPPLNVYFSGYRSAEGFEGYWMMRSLGAPFILFSDPRLEGGAFYIGSDELERQIEAVITDKLNELGFDRTQLVLSGMSMGTYGAMYYAAKLNPYALILSKPLANLGDIAINDKHHRPGEWATSLDILSYHTGGISDAHAKDLNNRFWNRVNSTTMKDAKILAVYMIQDDYDRNAYPHLVKSLQQTNVKIIGKGLIGRHNDGSSTATSWFYGQYINLMKDDFGRSMS